MHKTLPKPSMFQFGSLDTTVEVTGARESGLELFPVVDLLKSDIVGAVAGRLVVARTNNRSLEKWLPGPYKRYSTRDGAEKALRTVAKAQGKIAWIIQRIGDHSAKNACDPEAVVGIATIHENQRVAVNYVRQAGRYALVSYWTDPLAVIAEDNRAIAHTMFAGAPDAVLRKHFRQNVIASLDGPVFSDLPEGGVDTIFDPSAAFADVGQLWTEAQIIDGSTQDLADGIVANNSTRLYIPTQVQ